MTKVILFSSILSKDNLLSLTSLSTLKELTPMPLDGKDLSVLVMIHHLDF